MSQQAHFETRPGHPMKLVTSVTLMMCCVIVSVLLVVYALYFVQVSRIARDGVEDTALAIARTLADTPQVRQGLAAAPENNIIAPLTDSVQQRNDLLFAVVTNMQGVRYSHPDPQAVGKHFIGDDLAPALSGHENVSVNHGVLAEALRVFTPIYDDNHRQIGVVAIGISLSKVDRQINSARWSVLWTILFSALVGSLGIWILVRVLKRILFGLEPYEISARYEQRQAMLQSLKEGVIAVDVHGQVTMINHAARQMLLSPVSGHGPDDEAPHAPLLANLNTALRDGKALPDREISCNGRLLLSNTVPVRSRDAIIGAICTFRDKTEVQLLVQRLDGMVNYVDALRAHTHEFMNKLHVILGLLHMKSYSQLEEYVLQTAQNYQTDIGAIQRQIKSPVIAGFLLGKINRAKEAGHKLMLDPDCLLPDNPNQQQVATLITVLGNLIENALDAMQNQPDGEIAVLLHYQNGWLCAEVSDDGPGITADIIDAIFTKGFSTKGENRGVGLFLAKQQVEGAGGSLTVESEPGVFTQFFMQIPWDSERSQA
ncbi:two-component system sensor histidine kinase DcuS [Salmonella enterica subsp. enterica serovar Choleraesuis]|nr:two-component system sensor histidine kinase DcuS [Salmonella enterica subsp. enterica serovar Choleraesuis]